MKRDEVIIIGIVLAALAVALYVYKGFQSIDDGLAALLNGGNPSPGDGEGSVTSGTLVQTLAGLIQKFEGFYPGSVSFRNNNPGNIEEQGDAGVDGVGHAIFSSFEVGEAALISDLTAKIAKYPDFTINQLMNRYANGSNEDTPSSYADFIAAGLSKALGVVVTGETKIASLLGVGSEPSGSGDADGSGDDGGDGESE